MIRVVTQRPTAKSRRQRAVRPILEGLEDRMLLYAVNGDVFTYGSRITWSIEPDGTSLGGVSTNLISTLDADLGPESTWLPAIQDAFAEWEAVTNVNFAQVSDNGAPMGSGNIQQDSPNFGDIRIGGMAQSSNVLAFSLLPPPANGGSESGDIFFNTSQAWHIGSNYDLETVLVHEIGHALGLGESTVPSAVMYQYYGGVQPFPASDDIAGVQSIWGPRQEDPFEQSTDNLVMANAANVTGFMTQSDDMVYLPGLDVASTAQSYWFKVTTPANASNVFTAYVQSSSISELSPRVTIFNAAGQGLIDTSASPQSYGTTIYPTITNATPNTTYYIRVMGSNAGDSGTGAYTMVINMGYGYIPTEPPPNTLVYSQPSQGGGSQLMSVGGLGTSIKVRDLAGESNLKPIGGSIAAANTPVVIPLTIGLDSIPVPVSPIGSSNYSATHISIPHPVAQQASCKFSLSPVNQAPEDED